MATVRRFDGTGTTDELTTLGFTSAMSAMTFGCWLKRDSNITFNGLMGRMNSSGVGYSIFFGPAGFNQVILDINGVSALSVPTGLDLTVWTYLAVTYDDATNAELWYAGTTAANLALISTSTNAGGLIPAAGGLSTSFGNVNGLGFLGVGAKAFNGRIDQIQLANVVMTLDELKLACRCGSLVLPNNSLIADITGANPEPCTNLNSPDTLTVTGTTVESAIGIGCDNALADVTPVPPGNPPLVSPNLPHLSGGPGGGLGIPTLSWDDSGPASVSPMTTNAREVQPPDWGSMGIKGSMGGRRGGMLAQRQASMYRGLDHLASTLKRRRK